ncbi:hypothetical protein SGLAM104S_05414 [Streptomyces glaucescens]
MGGRAEADDEAVGAGGEGHVHVDAYEVPQGAFGIGHRPGPVVGLLEQLLRRAADVEAWQVFQERVSVGGLARGAVHRVLAQRAGVVFGVPLPRRVGLGGAGRRVQRGHQLQAGHGRGAAWRHHPRRVNAQGSGEVRRRQLCGVAPVSGVERIPGGDAQLDAGSLRAGGGAVDSGPRTEPSLGELPVGAGQLLDDLVALRDPSGQPFLVGEGDRQAVALQCSLGEDEQRIGVLARAGQLRLAQLALSERPLHQGGEGLGGHVQDQAAGAVRQDLPVGVDVDDCQRTVGEVMAAVLRRGAGRSGLLRARPARRPRAPGGTGRALGGGRWGDRDGAGLSVFSAQGRSLGRLPCRQRPLFRRRGRRAGERLGHRSVLVLDRGVHRGGVELGEPFQQTRVRIALRRAGLGLAGLPAADRGPAHPQRGGDLFDRQAVGLAQAPALLRWRQRGTGCEQRVDRVEQLGLGHGSPPDRHPISGGVQEAYVSRTQCARCLCDVRRARCPGLMGGSRQGRQLPRNDFLLHEATATPQRPTRTPPTHSLGAIAGSGTLPTARLKSGQSTIGS